MDSLSRGLVAGADGAFGLILMLLLLPVFVATSCLHRRREKEISTLDPSQIGLGERDFRLQSSQIEALSFSPPASGARFSMPWQLEARLQSGETRAWTLHTGGIPRAQIEGVRALEVPVHVG